MPKQYFKILISWFKLGSDSGILHPSRLTKCIRHLYSLFGIDSCSATEKGVCWVRPRVYFWDFSLKNRFCDLIKWHQNFLYFSRGEVFRLDIRHIRTKFGCYPKSSFRVTPSKRMFTILLSRSHSQFQYTLQKNVHYSVKQIPLPISVNSDLIYNFLSELNFGIIYFHAIRENERRNLKNDNVNREKIKSKFYPLVVSFIGILPPPFYYCR